RSALRQGERTQSVVAKMSTSACCKRSRVDADGCALDDRQGSKRGYKNFCTMGKEAFEMNINVSRQAVAEATEKLKNWGRWGKDDQIGTLNHITPEDIVRAAGLIRIGKVFALGIPLDRNGPQTGLFGGRWNPIHTMLATGTDAVAGRQDLVPNIRYADDD